MPYTPYNSHTNPSIYYGPPVKPVVTNGTPGNHSYPPAPSPTQLPPYLQPGYKPPSPFVSPMGVPTPPAPTGGGSGGGGDLWNGYQVVQRSPGGNVLVNVNGDLQAYDPWGNRIPHLYAGAAGGDPNGGAGGTNSGGGGAPTATPTVPGAPTPPQGTPQTFYSPTTGSPYLQLGGNFLSYLGSPERQQLDSVLRGAGFQSTGAMNTYGPSDYIRPPQFDQADINNLALSEPMRQWLRFFLGNLGYGQSYQLPQGYVPGSGLPMPPPMPQGGYTPPAPVADPYTP